MTHVFLHKLIRRVRLIVCILLIPTSISSTADKSDPLVVDSISNIRQLDELVVDGKGGFSEKIGHVSVSAAEINRTPTLLGERDLIKTLQSGSGVVSGAEGFAGLYVRGGENDQNLYLIDGLPLLNVYHFGGLFSTFSTHSIAGVDFYKGAFPASFSERTSSIVDITLKKPDLDKTSGKFSIGLISGQFYFSTPIRKNSSAISLALRRTWFDVFSVPALAIINRINKPEGKKTIFNYNFTDLILNLRITDRKRNELNILGFYGQDNFKLGEDRFNPKADNALFKSDRNKMAWGNLAMSLLYSHSADIGLLKVQPYVTKAFASDIQQNLMIDGQSKPLSSSSKSTPSVLQIGMKESFEFPIVPAFDGMVGMQQSWSDYNVGASIPDAGKPHTNLSNTL